MPEIEDLDQVIENMKAQKEKEVLENVSIVKTIIFGVIESFKQLTIIKNFETGLMMIFLGKTNF